jgi:uncharacterized protein with PQ loop repeat
MNLMLNTMAVTATLLGSGMAFPQARRLFRTRRVEGVSAAWIGVSVALNAWWLVYGLWVGVYALVPVSAVSLLMYLSIGVVFVRTTGRRSLRPIIGSAAALGAVPLPFLVLGGWAAAGLVAGLCYGLQLLPAVVAAYRSDELAGIAPGTWIIALVESALWLVYGLGVGDVALIAGGASGLTMSGLIVGRLAIVRERAVESEQSVIRLAIAR